MAKLAESGHSNRARRMADVIYCASVASRFRHELGNITFCTLDHHAAANCAKVMDTRLITIEIPGAGPGGMGYPISSRAGICGPVHAMGDLHQG